MDNFENVTHRFRRCFDNPILEPIKANNFEARAVFNPAVLYLEGKYHIVYRAVTPENTSTMGYATSKDGYTIDERLDYPIYTQREEFECVSCEDPRLTELDGSIYMFYTGYDGRMPRVAFSSISTEDFLNRKWENWDKARVITPYDVDDKDACVLPEKIDGKFVIIHRVNCEMRVNYVDDINEPLEHGGYAFGPSKKYWDGNLKYGLAGPPIHIDEGWLFIIHRVAPGGIYIVEALITDHKDITKVIAESRDALLEPERHYELHGDVNNVVFPCSTVLKDGEVVLHYGGADKVVGVCKMKVTDLLKQMVWFRR